MPKRIEPLLTSKSGVVNEHPDDDRFIPRDRGYGAVPVYDSRDLLSGDSHTDIARSQAEETQRAFFDRSLMTDDDVAT